MQTIKTIGAGVLFLLVAYYGMIFFFFAVCRIGIEC